MAEESQKLINELETMVSEIQEMEEAIKFLKDRLHEIAIDARESIEDEEQKIELARYVYWNILDVPVSVLSDGLMATSLHAFLKMIGGKKSSNIHCDKCGRPMHFTSRTDMKNWQSELRKMKKGRGFRWPEGYHIVCDDCREDIFADRNIQYREAEERTNKRLRELATMPYREYLQTPEWKERRKRHLISAGYRCQLCNSSGVTLNVHHRTYDRRGNERFTDLIVLCQDCHSTFHDERQLL
ncbi:MAG: HNH endonuclease [Chloroflexi bacterium]|nr:MAG: HNH endonuclease [Chloroflexota bacterium]MBL1194918.1 HNH endonuclease [Chloroflexota bacterium]NOH12209.1 HNH endonuclease [Chloroflexota bacterium]